MAPANFVANDGDGRDADPSDPGDWITAQEKTLYPDDCTGASETSPYAASDSTWHGTHMAGILAATANNSVGIAGIGWNVKVVPVRALGKCGGDLNDIADAIRWAAGLPVSGVPDNPNKASVISLSLGGGDACSTYMQSAVNAATAAGVTIVAATGNEGAIGLIAPANCNGVIAVTAHTINGENADYANVASTTSPKAEMLSAPGGGTPTTLGAGGPTDNPNWDGYYIWSTVLFGPTTPTSSTSSGESGPAYAGFVGTSAATPQVAGVAALIKALAARARRRSRSAPTCLARSAHFLPAVSVRRTARSSVSAATGCSMPGMRPPRSVRMRSRHRWRAATRLSLRAPPSR